MELEERQRICLRLIVSNPGQLGWMQIDRMMCREGVVPRNLADVLKFLRDQGWVVADGDPQLAATRYSPTDAGKRIL